ncbi:MAG TPA: thiamine pyrophosphate-binding protein, partial [Mycobacterium sp.]
ATARQLGLDVTWLIVDDGGYGILREYMTGSFGSAFGTELARPDFVALAEPGPSVVVLPTTLRMFAPTHVTS